MSYNYNCKYKYTTYRIGLLSEVVMLTVAIRTLQSAFSHLAGNL